ncbi:uncharacterized protein NEMAJ01_0808 [Nematocida major]|uniref:uncharacterized protein n=1 Tax=Nematocida major TaxID=1912982 RepID=UPI002007EA2A|nr:uncharacterized protein NEMAJ01_0808 [Nematocida major]KAH9385912.1 hypothetical protein NEMAJ01_0808 [Nematocida major]
MLQTLFIVGRNFRPITPFLSVFLVEEKGFTTKDIADRIIPWWLYSMLLFSLVLSWIVQRVGLMPTIVSSVVSEIAAYVILLGMKKRSVISTITIEVLMAYRNSTLVVDKRYYAENDQNMSVRYSTIRKISGIMASFLSQNMYCISGSSRPSVYLTIISQLLVLFFVLFVCKKNALPLDINAGMAGIKITPALVSKVFSYIGAFTLSVCFRIYIDLILIERTGDADIHPGLVKVLIEGISSVFYYVAYGTIRALQLLRLPARIQPQKNSNKPVHGYLEGIARVLAVVLAIPMVIYTSGSTRNSELLMCVSWVLQISGIYALKTTKNIYGGYLAYLLSFIGANITLYLSYNGINREAGDRILCIMSHIGGISAATHAIIDVISRRNRLVPQARFNIYAYLGSALFACAGALSLAAVYMA